MRKHGWQLPYHPLQVVAIAVFLALGFAFYVFYAPFVGKKMYQYIAMGLYTPLIVGVFALYIWAAATDPADPGVFKSKKYLRVSAKEKHIHSKRSKHGRDSASSVCEPNAPTKDGMSLDIEAETEENAPLQCSSWILRVLCLPCSFFCKCTSKEEESSDQHLSEDGMFYCSLCEIEVYKYSKHCRVCDKCVDSFDHHCRWLNNCIGKRNYRKFFTLMVFALLLLILQWSTGILVFVRCFLDRKGFGADVVSRLGSSFTIVPYIIVVVVCTILAMIASLPIVQLFFFHILLIKKGISTYDYIIALREQEQQAVGGPQSPQMSQVSSFTGLSSASSFNTFHRGAWCTPPRLFVEDQYDVVPPDTASLSSYGKKMTTEEPIKRKNPAVKISPWTLARLNAEEVSKAATEARKKSKILQPVSSRRQPLPIPGHETGSSFGSGGRRVITRLDSNRRRASKRIMLPSQSGRNGFGSGLSISSSAHIAGSSPESSLGSPEIARKPFSAARFELSRSNSDGYEASGGEDSDRVNWSSLVFGSNHDTRTINKVKASSSTFSQGNLRKH